MKQRRIALRTKEANLNVAPNEFLKRRHSTQDFTQMAREPAFEMDRTPVCSLPSLEMARARVYYFAPFKMVCTLRAGWPFTILKNSSSAVFEITLHCN